jgi:hypothetical protein
VSIFFERFFRRSFHIIFRLFAAAQNCWRSDSSIDEKGIEPIKTDFLQKATKKTEGGTVSNLLAITHWPVREDLAEGGVGTLAANGMSNAQSLASRIRRRTWRWE